LRRRGFLAAMTRRGLSGAVEPTGDSEDEGRRVPRDDSGVGHDHTLAVRSRTDAPSG